MKNLLRQNQLRAHSNWVSARLFAHQVPDEPQEDIHEPQPVQPPQQQQPPQPVQPPQQQQPPKQQQPPLFDLADDKLINQLFDRWSNRLGVDSFICNSSPTTPSAGQQSFLSFWESLDESDQQYFVDIYKTNKSQRIGREMNTDIHLILENHSKPIEQQIWNYYTFDQHIAIQPTNDSRNVIYPVDSEHPLYPFGSVFWVELADQLLTQKITPKSTDWIIQQFHSKKVTLNSSDVQWCPKNAVQLLCMYLDHHSFKNIHKVTLINHVTKDNIHWEDEIIQCGYDSIANDVDAMIKTPAYRKLLFQSVATWKQLHKANPIHRNGIRGKVHISETISGQSSLFKCFEKYTFIQKQQSDETIPEFDIVWIGNGLKNLKNGNFYMVYDIKNDKFNTCLQYNPMTETPQQFDTRMNGLFVEIEEDMKHDNNECIRPRCEVHLIPIYYDSNKSSFYIKLHPDEQLHDIIRKEILDHDKWEIFGIKVNNTLSFPNVNLNEQQHLFDLNYIFHYDGINELRSSTLCLTNDKYKYFFMDMIDPSSIIPIGTLKDKCECCSVSYDVNSDNFQCFHHSNGGIPMHSIKSWFSCINHNIASNNIIWDNGCTPGNFHATAFYNLYEKDVLSLLFKGMHTMFYDDEGQPVYKHVRLIPIKSIDDQGEHAPKAGRRGGNAIRQTLYTSEIQSDPIVCGHSVGHHQTFYTSTVE